MNCRVKRFAQLTVRMTHHLNETENLKHSETKISLKVNTVTFQSKVPNNLQNID